MSIDSHRRLFPDGLRHLAVLRDDVCRTPGCDAPVRHLDHVIDASHGGPTSWVNSQGLCERCNHAKQAARWRSQVIDGVVHTTTPTGWTTTSPVPPPVVTSTQPLDPLDWFPEPIPPIDLDQWDHEPPPRLPPDPAPWLATAAIDDLILIA